MQEDASQLNSGEEVEDTPASTRAIVIAGAAGICASRILGGGAFPGAVIGLAALGLRKFIEGQAADGTAASDSSASADAVASNPNLVPTAPPAQDAPIPQAAPIASVFTPVAQGVSPGLMAQAGATASVPQGWSLDDEVAFAEEEAPSDLLEEPEATEGELADEMFTSLRSREESMEAVEREQELAAAVALVREELEAELKQEEAAAEAKAKAEAILEAEEAEEAEAAAEQAAKDLDEALAANDQDSTKSEDSADADEEETAEAGAEAGAEVLERETSEVEQLEQELFETEKAGEVDAISLEEKSDAAEQEALPKEEPEDVQEEAAATAEADDNDRGIEKAVLENQEEGLDQQDESKTSEGDEFDDGPPLLVGERLSQSPFQKHTTRVSLKAPSAEERDKQEETVGNDSSPKDLEEAVEKLESEGELDNQTLQSLLQLVRDEEGSNEEDLSELKPTKLQPLEPKANPVFANEMSSELAKETPPSSELLGGSTRSEKIPEPAENIDSEELSEEVSSPVGGGREFAPLGNKLPSRSEQREDLPEQVVPPALPPTASDFKGVAPGFQKFPPPTGVENVPPAPAAPAAPGEIPRSTAPASAIPPVGASRSFQPMSSTMAAGEAAAKPGFGEMLSSGTPAAEVPPTTAALGAAPFSPFAPAPAPSGIAEPEGPAAVVNPTSKKKKAKWVGWIAPLLLLLGLITVAAAAFYYLWPRQVQSSAAPTDSWGRSYAGEDVNAASQLGEGALGNAAPLDAPAALNTEGEVRGSSSTTPQTEATLPPVTDEQASSNFVAPVSETAIGAAPEMVVPTSAREMGSPSALGDMPGAATAEAPIEPKSANQGLSPEVSDLQDIIYAFAEAATPEEKLPYIIYDDRIRTALYNYYEGSASAAAKLVEVRYAEKGADPKTGRANHLFYITTESSAGEFPVLVKETKDGSKVDWEGFVQEEENAVAKFFANPEAEARDFKVVISRSHSLIEGLAEGNQCFSVKPMSLDGAGGFRTYAAEASEAASTLSTRAPWGSQFAGILRLAWKKTPEGLSYVIVERLVNDGW